MLQQYLLSTILRQVRVEFCSCVFMVATAPIVHGIETKKKEALIDYPLRVVTVLTVYGIETWIAASIHSFFSSLQQYLPFTVLKLLLHTESNMLYYSCNSTYRLRYAPKGARQQRSRATMRPTYCKYLKEVKVKQRC